MGEGLRLDWLSENMMRKVGGGQQVRFWIDFWVGNGPLCERYNRLYTVVEYKDCLISESGRWEGKVWS